MRLWAVGFFVVWVGVCFCAQPAWAEEEAELLFLEPEAESVDAGVTTLEPIRVEGGVSADLGGGSFEQELRLEGAQNFSQALESSVLAFGDPSSKGQRKVVLRGFDIRQISLRFEDMPLDTGYDAIISLDVIPINWLGALRVKTANSGVFDDLAMGAGIEMLAARAARFEASLGIERHGFWMSAAHSGSAGAYHWTATAGGQYSGGWDMAGGCKPSKYEDCGLRDNSDKHGGNVFVLAGRELGSWGEFTLMGGWVREGRGVVIGVDTAVPRFWRFASHDLAFSLARLDFTTPNVYGRLQAWVNYQGNILDAYDDARYETQIGEAAYRSWMRDFDVGLLALGGSRPFSWGRAGFVDLRVRTELRYQFHDGRDEHLGERREDGSTDRILFQFKPGVYWKFSPKLELFADAGFVANFELHKPSSGLVNVGLQNRYNGVFSVGMDYAILERLKISARVARRLRMPTLKEQFVEVLYASNVRYKDLNAEYNWDMQAQIHYEAVPGVKLSLTGYDSEVRDLIQFTYIDGLRQATNLDRARLAGLIFLAELGPFVGVSAQASYHFAHTRDLKQKRELLERPAHQLRAAVQYEIAGLTLGANFLYESSRLSDDWTGTAYRRLGAIYLLGAFVEYALGGVTLSFRANNLLDMHYQRAFGYPEPGRNFFLGAKISLD